MTTVSYADLSDAFEFVCAAEMSEAHAFIARDSGKIYWPSKHEDLDEDLPEDVDDRERYLFVPHKRELDLGTAPVMRFARLETPNLYARVEAIFSRRGGYSRFKALLTSEGLLDKWHAFEAEATERALKKWAEANGIRVI